MVMTVLGLPQWQVVLRWDDGVRSTVQYTGSLWIGPMSQGVHGLALACYAQRRATELDLPKQMSYLILHFTPVQIAAQDVTLPASA
jgi:hypothetical protein